MLSWDTCFERSFKRAYEACIDKPRCIRKGSRYRRACHRAMTSSEGTGRLAAEEFMSALL